MTAPDRPGAPDGRSAPETAGQAAAPGQAHKVRAALSEAVGHAMQSANTCKAKGPCEGCESNHEAAMNLADTYAQAAIAAAAPAPAGEGGNGLRGRLEALLESWSSLPEPGDQVSACAAAVRHALEDHLTPAASRGREGRLAAALAYLAADGQWLTVTEDGRLDIRDELLARKRYARDALAGNIAPQPQPAPELAIRLLREELDLARAETAGIRAAAANTARDLAEVTAERDKAYRERAALVAYLTSAYPSVMLVDSADPDWPIVFVSTPSGQMSWHIAATDTDLFQHVPATTEPTWDGHTTGQKYERLADLTRRNAPFVYGSEDGQ